VQASHAALECGRALPGGPTVDNLIVIGVPDEESLLEAHRLAEHHGVRSVLFREPDINNEATALCTEAVDLAGGRPFRRYKLWKEDLVCHQSS
jgi:hypothetical protein